MTCCPQCGSDAAMADGRLLDEDDREICELGRCTSCGALVRFEAGVTRALTLDEALAILDRVRLTSRWSEAYRPREGG